jgi:hypothetical protein
MNDSETMLAKLFCGKVLMDRAILSRQIGAFRCVLVVHLPGSRNTELCEQPSIPGIPAHAPEFVLARNFFARECQGQKPGQFRLKFNLSPVPGENAPDAERLLFEISAVNGIFREALSLNCKSPLSLPARGVFQERPGSQDPIMNDSQIKVRPPGIMLVDHKS